MVAGSRWRVEPRSPGLLHENGGDISLGGMLRPQSGAG
jgi:hypothetical protein